MFRQADRRRRARPVSLVVALLCLNGCAVGPDFVRPEPPHTARYTRRELPQETTVADGRAQQFEPGAVASAWWQLFANPALDELITQAVSANPTLQAAQASLRESEDELRAGYAVFLPQIDATAAASRQRSFAPSTNLPKNTFNLFTLGGTVEYAVDVFGGERRAVEGASAQVDVQRYETAAAYLTLVGNVVNAVIAQAGYSAQIAATERLIEREHDQLQITAAQATAGTVPYTGVLAIQTQAAAIEAQLPAIEQKRTQTRHLLATLLGEEPAAWTSPQIDLAELQLPREVPVTLPSELVRQRPDILAAEAQLHNASAQIGVATAAMFPQITLSGSYGSTSTSISELFTGPAAVWAIGGQLAQPLFHGGALWFQRRAAIDAYDQSTATYRQTVLGGLAQVADVLRALEHDATQVEAQSRQEDTAHEALRVIDVTYRTGLANYLDVLVADVQYNQATIERIGGQVQRLQDTVALFVALGGGWWDAQDRVVPDCSPCTPGG